MSKPHSVALAKIILLHLSNKYDIVDMTMTMLIVLEAG